MKATRLAGFVAAGFVLMLASCASPVSLGGYIEAMERETDAYVVESQNLSYDYQSTVEDGVRAIVASGSDTAEADALALVVEQTTQYLSLLGDAMARYGAALADIDPPSEVADEHAAYVAAVDHVIVSLPPTRDSVAAVDNLADVQYVLGSSGFADGQLRWRATCESLEQAVRDDGQGIDLRCTPEAGP